MSGQETSPEPPSVAPKCPRCGGVTFPRRNRGMKNPFLSKKSKTEQLTCEDCGLDFDRPTDSSRDSGRDSGRSPWSKP